MPEPDSPTIAERVAAVQREADAVDGAHPAASGEEVRLQVRDLEDGLGLGLLHGARRGGRSAHFVVPPAIGAAPSGARVVVRRPQSVVLSPPASRIVGDLSDRSVDGEIGSRERCSSASRPTCAVARPACAPTSRRRRFGIDGRGIGRRRSAPAPGGASRSRPPRTTPGRRGVRTPTTWSAQIFWQPTARTCASVSAVEQLGEAARAAALPAHEHADGIGHGSSFYLWTAATATVLRAVAVTICRSVGSARQRVDVTRRRPRRTRSGSSGGGRRTPGRRPARRCRAGRCSRGRSRTAPR